MGIVDCLSIVIPDVRKCRNKSETQKDPNNLNNGKNNNSFPFIV